MWQGRADRPCESTRFLLDPEAHLHQHGQAILDKVAKEHSQAYFAGMVQLARIIRWEIGKPSEFERPRSPEEIMDKLEERVGPEGRKLFEQFLAKVNRLEEQQQMDLQPEEASDRETDER